MYSSLVPRPPQAFIACSDKSLGRPGHEARCIGRNFEAVAGYHYFSVPLAPEKQEHSRGAGRKGAARKQVQAKTSGKHSSRNKVMTQTTGVCQDNSPGLNHNSWCMSPYITPRSISPIHRPHCLNQDFQELQSTYNLRHLPHPL